MLDAGERGRLVVAPRFKPEAARDDKDHLIAVERARHHLADRHLLRIEFAAKMRDQRGFAGPHLPGDDDEPFPLVQTIPEIGERFFVRDGFEIKGRIRGQLKRAIGESVEAFVHKSLKIRSADRSKRKRS